MVDYNTTTKHMANKQTAVEWLYDQIIIFPESNDDLAHNARSLKQAKVMFKEQIMNAVDYGAERFGDISEQYYNETYGN
jgi:hypothetical protein